MLVRKENRVIVVKNHKNNQNRTDEFLGLFGNKFDASFAKSLLSTLPTKINVLGSTVPITWNKGGLKSEAKLTGIIPVKVGNREYKCSVYLVFNNEKGTFTLWYTGKSGQEEKIKTDKYDKSKFIPTIESLIKTAIMKDIA